MASLGIVDFVLRSLKDRCFFASIVLSLPLASSVILHMTCHVLACLANGKERK